MRPQAFTVNDRGPRAAPAPPSQVGTANFHRGDWGKTEQLLWIHDSARRPAAAAAAAAAAPSEFARTLAAFVRASLHCDSVGGDRWSARVLDEFDVDPGSHVALVPLVPSRFRPDLAAALEPAPRDEADALGARRLNAVVAARMGGFFDADANPVHAYRPPYAPPCVGATVTKLLR